MLATVIQIDGYDPVAGAAVTLRAASRDHPAVCHLDGQTWWPTIAKLPTLRYDLFDGAFGGEITAPTSSTTLSVEPWPDFGRYSLADARFRLWTGDVGAEWATYTLRFDGRVSEQPETKDGQTQVAFGVDDRWLDQALLPTYAGTTGIEGAAALKGQVKPLCLGAPRYVPGVLVDVVNSVFQVSFAAVKAITAAMDRLVRFGAPAADYATYTDLVAATVPPGRWATCLASGLARFGAPPEGLISFLVEGDNGGPNGWARLPGQLIRRLALLSGAGDRLVGATLDALDAARPYQLSLYLDAQTTARQLIQQLAASVNAVAAVSWTGKLVVLPVQLSAPTITLAADGSALPPVASVGQVAIAAPWSKLAIGAERAWAVHNLADIAFTAPLLELGPYNAATIYREGNIVSRDDGSRWLYVAAAASAGNAPPNLPTTSNTWWRLLSKGGTVDLTQVNQRIDTVEGKANDSLSRANTAAADAAAANAAVELIARDDVLDRGEKSRIIAMWEDIVREQTPLVAQADAVGVDRTQLQAKQFALGNYLGSLSQNGTKPAWNDITGNTPIVGADFRKAFADYYDERTKLLMAIAAKIQSTAQAAADKAIAAAADAATATARIAKIVDNNVLDAGEKPGEVAEVRRIREEYQANLNAAARYANQVNTASYTAVYNALIAYFDNELVPPATSYTTDTPIVRDTYITKFADYYQTRQYLLNDIAYAASLWGNITGDMKPDDGATLGMNMIRSWDRLLRTTYVGGAYKEGGAGGLGGGANVRDRHRVVFPVNGGQLVAAYFEPVVGALAVTPGDRLFAAFDGLFTTGTFRFVIRFFNVAGGDLGAIFADIGSNGTNAWRTLGGMVFTVPDPAASAQVYVQWYNGSGVAYAAMPVLQRVQPGADATAAQIAAGVADSRIQGYTTPLGARTGVVEQKTTNLGTDGRGTSTRLNSIYTNRGAQQVYIPTNGNTNVGGTVQANVPGSPLWAYISPGTNGQQATIQVFDHKLIDDAGTLYFGGAIFYGAQPNSIYWVYEQTNGYTGGNPNYVFTTNAEDLNGPNKRLVGSVPTPPYNAPDASGYSGGSGGGGGIRERYYPGQRTQLAYEP